MLSHELLEDEAILIVKPEGALESSDFETIAKAVDPYIETQGDLRGLLIQSESFPGWRDFGALIAHLRFIRNHHKHIRKVAAVTDSAFASIAPHVAAHFVSADVRHFDFANRDAAMAWLRETSLVGATTSQRQGAGTPRKSRPPTGSR